MSEFNVEKRGRCSKCGNEVALIGDQLKTDDLPVFSKDMAKKVGFYCSTCSKVFCGGCSIDFAGKSEGMGEPRCPLNRYHGGLNWAEPHHQHPGGKEQSVFPVSKEESGTEFSSENQEILTETENDQQKTPRKFTCEKCGSSDFEYDNYWKEYSCKKCGWITKNGAILPSQDHDEKITSSKFTEPYDHLHNENDKTIKKLKPQKEKGKSVIFEHTLNLGYIFSGILRLSCAFGILIITENLLNNDKLLNESPLFFLGGASVLIFLLYKLTYAGFRDLNLLRLKSISFEGQGVNFIYKKENKFIEKVLTVQQKWLSVLILGKTKDGNQVELKISKGFFKTNKDRRTFIELLNNYV